MVGRMHHPGLIRLPHCLSMEMMVGVYTKVMSACDQTKGGGIIGGREIPFVTPDLASGSVLS